MNRFRQDLGSDRNIKITDLYMYKNTTIPGVLIECGYLSNFEERKKLQEIKYQKKLASTIAKGVVDYLKADKKIKYIM